MLNTNKPNSQYEIPAPAESTEQFYAAIEARIPEHVSAVARLEIQTLLLDMRRQSERAKIIHWTREEQQAFYGRLEELFRNPGEYTPNYLAESVRALVTEKLANEMSLTKRHNILDVDMYRVPKDVAFNFPILDKTTIVGLELHLAFSPENSVDEALTRLTRQYRAKYNAIILLDSE
jgi:hypothetical protein